MTNMIIASGFDSLVNRHCFYKDEGRNNWRANELAWAMANAIAAVRADYLELVRLRKEKQS